MLHNKVSNEIPAKEERSRRTPVIPEEKSIEDFKNKMRRFLVEIETTEWDEHIDRLTKTVELTEIKKQLCKISKMNEVEYLLKEYEDVFEAISTYKCNKCLISTCIDMEKFIGCVRCPEFKGNKPCGRADNCKGCTFMFMKKLLMKISKR